MSEPDDTPIRLQGEIRGLLQDWRKIWPDDLHPLGVFLSARAAELLSVLNRDAKDTAQQIDPVFRSGTTDGEFDEWWAEFQLGLRRLHGEMLALAGWDAGKRRQQQDEDELRAEVSRLQQENAAINRELDELRTVSGILGVGPFQVPAGMSLVTPEGELLCALESSTDRIGILLEENALLKRSLTLLTDQIARQAENIREIQRLLKA